ncbi:MAG: hypothetical protein FWD85_10610 [Microbacteriaceae bacterium]|nr:hypothetical protein [Microbacteriaceae bacterium]
MGAVNPRRHPLIWAAVAVGLFGFAVSFALSWVPSLDFNEAATVISALRPWPALWREIHHIDAVHATYYAFMHLWFDLVGYSPLALRVPASVAAGVAAGLLVLLGTRLGNLRIGLAAGIVFAVLPQTMWMGFEGRQYEASMALATGLVLLFLAARERSLTGRRSWPWWAGYAVLGIVSQYVFGYLFMVDFGLMLLLVWPLLRRATRTRVALRTLGKFVVVVAVTIAAWVPLALLEVHEQGQVSWIQGLSFATLGQVLGLQFFPGNIALAVVGWAAATAGAVAGIAAWRRGRHTPARAIMAVALPWLVIPLGILLFATALGHHLYTPRYLAFTTPALALLIAVPITWIRMRRAQLVSALAIAAVVALAVPTWAAQRTTASKEKDSWNQIAAVITAERKEEPKGAQNVVVFGAAPAHRVVTSQVIADLYPSAFAGMDDITLATSYDQASGLWDTSRPLSAVLSRAKGANFVWVLTTTVSHQQQPDTRMLQSIGFRLHESWKMNGAVVLQFVNPSARA